jgi:hypothetical protein
MNNPGSCRKAAHGLVILCFGFLLWAAHAVQAQMISIIPSEEDQILDPCPAEWLNDGLCNELGIGRGNCAHGTDAVDCAQWTGPNDCLASGDGICDEPGIGTGFCPAGTDSYDCDPPVGGPDSCEYAHSGSCDEPVIGSGLCRAGTDTSDCAEARSNSCSNAYDGFCDPGIGHGGDCEPGTDTADCDMRQAHDSCVSAFDGTCDEADLGNGSCAFGTDSADCRDARAVIWASACPWARNGQCDEPGGSGLGVCARGTDEIDCWYEGVNINPLGGSNSCVHAFNLACDAGRSCPSGFDEFDCEAEGAATGGLNGCPTARNGVCEEPLLGDGSCDLLTDTADCQPVREANTCDTAFDNRCDELRIGRLPCPVIGPTGLGYSCEEIFQEEQICAPYTDSADCERLRGTPGDLNSCALSFDGICDEPGGGTGLCFESTDAMDCSMNFSGDGIGSEAK